VRARLTSRATARVPVPLLLLALLLAGCRGCPSSRPPIHLNPNMDRQPKLLAQAESGFFADGAAMRRPVEGTVPHGQLPESAWREGRDAGGVWVERIPVPVDARLLARGAERYGVFCAPCHGPTANGKGMLFQRAKVESANLLAPQFRAAPVGQLFDSVTNGVGLMPPYGSQVPVADRWAILAFLRQLQADNSPVSEEEVGDGMPPAGGAAMTPEGTATAPAAPEPAPAAPPAEGAR
jgi:mono/diheme cytochrome c family protein